MCNEVSTMRIAEYVPEQPFFELNTKRYESSFGSPRGLLAQYYSFVVSSQTEDAVVAVPDGTIDIIFHCSENKPEALVCGSVKRGKHIHFETRGLYFGARFYPGAAEKLLGCRLDAFTEQEVQLEDVLSRTGELMERISGAGSFSERVDLFESYHISRVDRKPLPFLVKYVLEKINSTSGDVRIQELADETGYYDQAHFINEFKEFSLSTPTQVISRRNAV